MSGVPGKYAKKCICEICGNQFEKAVYPSYIARFGKPRFCSVKCRNSYCASQKKPIPVSKRSGWRKCVTCGKWGLRNGDYCSLHYDYRTLWNDEMTDFLVKNYPTRGAEWVAKKLKLTPKQVHQKVTLLGIRLTDEARDRLVSQVAREYMTKNNPMFESENRQKVKQWYIDHPKEAAERVTRIMEGNRRIQKDKPTKLEIALFAHLDTLGVEYEPFFLVKPKWIVDAKCGNTIIQADGDYWHGHPRFEPLTERQLTQKRRDKAQDAYLTTCGYTVARIWESDMCIEAVSKALGLDPSIIS